MSKTDKKTIAALRGELGELLTWFESDEFTPEEAVEKFKAAEKLAETIEVQLLEHKNTITVLKQRFDTEEH